MAEKEKTNGSVGVADDALTAVSGGTSLYDEASGLDRDSWFVNLMSKLTQNNQKPTQTQSAQNNPVPLSTFIVGDYSSLSEQ